MKAARVWMVALVSCMSTLLSYAQFSDSQMETARLTAEMQQAGLLDKGALLVCQSVAGMIYLSHNALLAHKAQFGNDDPAKVFHSMSGAGANQYSVTLGDAASIAVLRMVARLHERFGIVGDLYSPTGEVTTEVKNDCLKSYLEGNNFLEVELSEATARTDAYAKSLRSDGHHGGMPGTSGTVANVEPTMQQCVAKLMAYLDPRSVGAERQRESIHAECEEQPGPAICLDHAMREYRKTSASGGIPHDVMNEFYANCRYVAEEDDFPE